MVTEEIVTCGSVYLPTALSLPTSRKQLGHGNGCVWSGQRSDGVVGVKDYPAGVRATKRRAGEFSRNAVNL